MDFTKYDEIMDAQHLASKFCKGLSKSVHDQISMSERQPAYDDYAGWVEAARKVTDNREANCAFEDTLKFTLRNPVAAKPLPLPQKASTLAPHPFLFFHHLQVPAPASQNPPAPSPPAPAPKAPDTPVPMEVDWTRGNL